LALRQVMDWACQIAAGLAAAHARNIVHRDIKPSNIIITKENSARIVDFGLARVVATPSATMTGGTTGTLPYMSPEQILGEAVDQRCDVWALAILLVQMVTGSHPFAREGSTAMTFAILNQLPAAVDSLPGLCWLRVHCCSRLCGSARLQFFLAAVAKNTWRCCPSTTSETILLTKRSLKV